MPYTVKVLSFCRVISWYCGMVRSSSDQIYQVICQCRLYNTSSELSNSSYHIICSKKTYNLWWLGNGILVEISKCKFKHTPLLIILLDSNVYVFGLIMIWLWFWFPSGLGLSGFVLQATAWSECLATVQTRNHFKAIPSAIELLYRGLYCEWERKAWKWGYCKDRYITTFVLQWIKQYKQSKLLTCQEE